MKKGALQSACTQLLISFLAILFIWEPIFSLAVFFPLTPAQAATTSGYQEDAVCKSRVLSYISLQAIASIDYTPSESEVTLEDDLGDYSP
ncbi:MAG: hypothetical protein WCG94_08045, partial [Methanothrix sp.]